MWGGAVAEVGMVDDLEALSKALVYGHLKKRKCSQKIIFNSGEKLDSKWASLGNAAVTKYFNGLFPYFSSFFYSF